MNLLQARRNAFKEKNQQPTPDQSVLARLKLAGLTEPGRKIYLQLDKAWEKCAVSCDIGINLLKDILDSR